MSGATPATQHHGRFYFQLVTFLVEDCLFRVPDNPLVQSEVFRDLFLLPVEGHEAEGQSDANPIILEGIKKEDFESLMKVLCPLPVSSSQPEALPVTQEEWLGVLKLSKMWGFNSIYEFAIENLEPILAEKFMDKVVLAQEYGITKWLLPGLLGLARRAEPIGTEDARKIGLDTALKLADVRESMQKNITVTVTQYHRGHSSNTASVSVVSETANGPRGATTCDFTQRIRQVFGLANYIPEHVPSDFS